MTPEGPVAPTPPAPRWRTKLMATLPYIATAVVAVLCSLLIQSVRWPLAAGVPVAATQEPTVAATVSPSPTPQPRATASPASELPADESILRLQVLDLEAADRRLWSAIYLLRAASQIDDSIVALQANDLDEVNRVMLNARRSLDRAYAFSAEQEKGPIDTFRLQISQARDDLRVRPEGLDRRLRQMRLLILSLVDEGGAS
ncbi:hypothetical protein EKD04_006095 [Chloroflexales bacterium ZM16-3]|nr:hypothetical protein [Chloroflexales bacterium ZM16-3]